MATETDPQVLDTLDQLKRQVKVLQERADDLETINAKLMANGLDDMLKGHGFQQFGGGLMRTGSVGIQIQNSSIGDPNTSAVIAFVHDFNANPYAANPTTLIQGMVDALGTPVGAEMYLLSRVDANNRVWLDMQSANVSNSQLGAKYGGIEAQVNVRSGATSLYVQIYGAPLWLPVLTTDPTNLEDGMVWYRGDTDRFRVRANGITRDLQMAGTNTTLTIATGVITATTSFHGVDTESAAASDDLDTINGGQVGQILVIHAANSARTVVAKDGTGNLYLAGDCTLDNAADTLTLIYDGAQWLEIARADNGA